MKRIFPLALLTSLSMFASNATCEETASAADLSTMQGNWIVTAAEQSGRPFDIIKGGLMTVAGDDFVIKTVAGNRFDGKVRLNADVAPKQIDFVLSTGALWEGIYSVSPSILRINRVESEDGISRPTVFATTADTPGLIMVMRRSEIAASDP
jgi:uncharacterized protein (TIGR03067 family)